MICQNSNRRQFINAATLRGFRIGVAGYSEVAVSEPDEGDRNCTAAQSKSKSTAFTQSVDSITELFAQCEKILLRNVKSTRAKTTYTHERRGIFSKPISKYAPPQKNCPLFQTGIARFNEGIWTICFQRSARKKPIEEKNDGLSGQCNAKFSAISIKYSFIVQYYVYAHEFIFSELPAIIR